MRKGTLLIACDMEWTSVLSVTSLREAPVEIKMRVKTAEMVVVGPDRGGTFWTLFFDWSFKRGDWLRPVTGRRAKPEEIREWRRARRGP